MAFELEKIAKALDKNYTSGFEVEKIADAVSNGGGSGSGSGSETVVLHMEEIQDVVYLLDSSNNNVTYNDIKQYI